jgi:hypothetical protein
LVRFSKRRDCLPPLSPGRAGRALTLLADTYLWNSEISILDKHFVFVVVAVLWLAPADDSLASPGDNPLKDQPSTYLARHLAEPALVPQPLDEAIIADGPKPLPSSVTLQTTLRLATELNDGVLQTQTCAILRTQHPRLAIDLYPYATQIGPLIAYFFSAQHYRGSAPGHRREKSHLVAVCNLLIAISVLHIDGNECIRR